MPASKALLWVVILGLLVATGVFAFFPDTRPNFVKSWFRAAAGFKPAQSPDEALTKFRECIKKRDYETAAELYCTGDYREQMRKAAKAANKLGEAVGDLEHNVKDVAALNAPKAFAVFALLEPFPLDFDVADIKKQGEDRATAYISLKGGKGLSNPNVTFDSSWKVNPKIMLALVPVGYDGPVELKLEGEKEKSWRIDFPVTSHIRATVPYLIDNYGNYVQVMKNLKYSIKHDAATKEQFENELKTELAKLAND